MEKVKNFIHTPPRSIGLNFQSVTSSAQMFVTEKGERPGDKKSLEKFGMTEARADVNLCIFRSPNWVLRRGSLELVWRPDRGEVKMGYKDEL